jgi:hypothetical protein
MAARRVADTSPAHVDWFDYLGVKTALLPRAASMTRGRLWLVHAVIVLVVGGQLYDMVRDEEHWPFGPYEMFSYVDEAKTYDALRVFGVRGVEELPLLVFDYLRPFDQARFTTVLGLIRDSDPSGTKMREALRDTWARYEQGRQARRHRGPPIDGVRLYAVMWRLDPTARKVSAPEHRELIMEFRPREGGPSR